MVRAGLHSHRGGAVGRYCPWPSGSGAATSDTSRPAREVSRCRGSDRLTCVFQTGDDPQRFHEVLVLVRRPDCNPEFVPQSLLVEPAHIDALRYERSVEFLGTRPSAAGGNARKEEILLRGRAREPEWGGGPIGNLPPAPDGLPTVGGSFATFRVAAPHDVA